jgi:hypothetical protein
MNNIDFNRFSHEFRNKLNSLRKNTGEIKIKPQFTNNKNQE